MDVEAHSGRCRCAPLALRASQRGPENRSRNSWYASFACATAALPRRAQEVLVPFGFHPPVDLSVYPANEKRRHAVDSRQVTSRTRESLKTRNISLNNSVISSRG